MRYRKRKSRRKREKKDWLAALIERHKPKHSARPASGTPPAPGAVRIQHSPGGLRGRWLMNSLSFVVVILAAVVIAVTMGFSSYYYNSIHDMLSYRMSTLTTNFYNSGWLGNLEYYYYGMEKTIGDFERISDHAVNILSSAEELERKGLTFSGSALNELSVLTAAVREILSLSLKAFSGQDPAAAQQVEPLEQVIDTLKEQMRTRHILRMQQGTCSIEAGFVLSDLLTDLERTSDHCSNIAGCVIDAREHNLNLHETLRQARSDDGSFQHTFEHYVQKYQLPIPSNG